PCVETDADGRLVYSEHHHTLADHVNAVVGARLVIDRVVEPEWPAGRTEVWGGWGPVRGALLPGTLIVLSHLPA
ncbi:MAG TPA: SAM-dependent methyltransferase, partial [Actinotalea sp.]|nr:SAM-dependent methyltransferase [Actinotalea sp.]